MTLSAPEPVRLAALRDLDILDSEPEPQFDRIVALARRLFDVPMAAVTFIDEHRQWLKSRAGLKICETARSDSFCTHTIQRDEVLVVPDTLRDPRFDASPLVRKRPAIRFYAGAPLSIGPGVRLGALCIMDDKPRQFPAADREALLTLAAVVSDELRLKATLRKLAEQTETMSGILGSAGDGIVVADMQGRFTVFNTRAEELLGRGAEDVDPSRWSDVYGVFRADGKTRFPSHELPLARALRGERTDRVELVVRSPRRGKDVKLQISGRPVKGPDGELQGGMVTFMEVTAFRGDQERLVKEARTDVLTGLPNRRVLMEKLSLQAGEAVRGRSYAVAMCDLDKFKSINDTFGHAAGDRVLAGTARALRESLRGTDLVARFGGEEFCVVLLDVDAKRAREIAEKLRGAVKRLDGPRPLTISLGVASSETLGALKPEAMIGAADKALYRAKENGRDRVEMAGPGDAK
jgi:diguanylate cyclase (GGDEF)-like protein/PAS domain S-box-containing protein